MTQLTIPQAIAQGMQLQQAGQLQQAESIYRQVLSAQPNHPDALHLLGIIALQSGQPGQAADLIRRAISFSPTTAHYHCNLAMVLANSGQMEPAIAAAQEGLRLRPDYPEALNNLGFALQALSRTRAAIAAYRRALALRPEFADVCNNLGNALRDVGEHDEAIEVIRRGLSIRPNDAQALNSLGSALRSKGLIEEAVAAFERTLELQPDHAKAHNNLGNALRDLNQPEKAMEHFRRALELSPDLPEIHNNLAGAIEEMGQFTEAIFAYRKAVEVGPRNVMAHTNLGMALLRQGEFDEGWREYAWRLRGGELAQRLKAFTKPMWDGTELNGRTLLVFAEQGLGDSMHFARYLPLAAQRGAKIIFMCQPELKRLFAQSLDVKQLLTPADPLPEYDMHCPLLSLPMLMETTPRTIPADIPYLIADPELSSRWRERMISGDPRTKVGLVWAGRKEYQNDRRRSLDLAMLAPLAEAPDAAFFSLQKGAASEQARGIVKFLPMTDWSDDLLDLADTAALIDNLDRVITVDTAVAHLAGAMGKPTWVLLPHSPDWRWLLDRSDSPWYPTMRLFRQPAVGDWETPVHEITRRLRNESTSGQ